MDSNTAFTITRENEVMVQRDVEMSIRRSDWKRIARKVGQIPSAPDWHNTVGGAFLGAGLSAVLSALSLPHSTEGLAGWLVPVYWVSAAFFTLLAAQSLWAGWSTNTRIQSGCNEVLEDMREQYTLFFPNESL